MMESFIKVCGIQTREEALGAVEAGANTLGLLVGLTHYAEDKITAERAKQIISCLPAHIRTVLVTHLLNADEIIKLANEIGVKAIQIHDDLSIDGIRQLRKRFPNLELIKAVHVLGEDAIEKAKSYADEVEMLLLDSRTKDRLGGTGLVHDWNVSARIVTAVKKPVILAGGLTPENIVEAINKVQPAGIDANSGLEHPDGSKDFKKIQAFASAGKLCKPFHLQ